MEPVPETESLENFQSSPLPTLRLQQPRAISTRDFEFNRKPPTVRRSTEPTSPSSPAWATPPALSLPYRPRTTSPLSGTHTRSKSAASLAPPSMSRTRSMPGFDVAGRLSSPLLRPESPSGSPNRTRQRRKPADEAFPPTSPIRSSVLESSERLQHEGAALGHRRTESPLRHAIPIPPASQATTSLPSTPSSVATSPSYRYDMNSGGYNFPSYYPPSSVPSTPTSIRSRSPSISSLETIPDSPDAEEAALEDERMAKLRAAAEGSDGEDSSGESKGRNSADLQPRGRTLGLGSRDKRKRWSVCGAERRGDIDLETIWED
ncbi:hypothetical protein JX265_010312 [Neoarthrinium moseri]|uniref:Basic proline-rich protein n=1 Tax=Neoarthrinium moseri TaxID=1658444 RepID=A0A9Q0AM04_9PEZI|nr:uncharacterized protein JN550_003490 [Neoarthrinium moseri]KAI1844254.1 hypothetical protein JX266_009545 [Neoarthrinium moseri]KAI1859863.1 hypothetical protein JX265_010312 [Neoarthrinium moseri]KAI1873237.1 hypothetical protein JN550_003490 [Neoarthrinium moseri]